MVTWVDQQPNKPNQGLPTPHKKNKLTKLQETWRTFVWTRDQTKSESPSYPLTPTLKDSTNLCQFSYLLPKLWKTTWQVWPYKTSLARVILHITGIRNVKRMNENERKWEWMSIRNVKRMNENEWEWMWMNVKRMSRLGMSRASCFFSHETQGKLNLDESSETLTKPQKNKTSEFLFWLF